MLVFSSITQPDLLVSTSFWQFPARFRQVQSFPAMFWSSLALFRLVPAGSVPFQLIQVYLGRFKRFSSSFAMFSTGSAWFSAGLVIFRLVYIVFRPV